MNIQAKHANFPNVIIAGGRDWQAKNFFVCFGILLFSVPNNSTERNFGQLLL